MNAAFHRASSQPITGVPQAKLAGTGLGAGVGTAVGLGILDASSEARAFLPPVVQHAIMPRLHWLTTLTRPAREVTQLVAQATVRALPTAAFALYAPSKVADGAAALWAMAVVGTSLADEQALLTRTPYAPYPRACDPRLPANGCPDPLAYLHAAQLAPYLFATAGVLTGAAAGRLLGAYGWPLVAPKLAAVPDEAVDAMPNLLGRLVAHATLRGARQATRELAARAAMAAQQRAEEGLRIMGGGTAPHGSAANFFGPVAEDPSANVLPTDQTPADTTPNDDTPPDLLVNFLPELADEDDQDGSVFYDATEQQPDETTPLLLH